MAEFRKAPKILFLIRSLELGGAERIFSTYVNHAQSFEPVVLLHRFAIAPQNQLKSQIACSQVLPAAHPWRNIKPRKAPSAPGGTRENRSRVEQFLDRLPVLERFFEGLQLRKYAKQNQCDVISSFMLKSNRVAVFTKLVFAPHLRVVVNVHEYMSQHLAEIYPFIVERLVHRWLSRLVFRKADLIVAVAEGVKKDLVSNFGVYPEKIVVVPNPIDLQLIRRMAAEPLKDRPWGRSDEVIFVAVGRLVKLKGFDLLIRAFAGLPAETRAQLIIIGGGEDREKLQKLVESSGLKNKVFLIGQKKNPWKYMAQADIFVLSSHTEAFPNVLGEALALEKPVLATECSAGIREYLQDGKCGFLVAPGDPNALTDGLMRMLTDKAMCQRMVRNAAARVEEFDIASMVKTYERVLKVVLQRA